jgi:hypothetical protein
MAISYYYNQGTETWIPLMDINVPAHNDTTSLQGGTAGQYYHLTAAQNTNIGNVTTAGWALLDDADNAAQRTTLGLGSMATETATNYVAKSLFDANSILYATVDDTPAALALAANTIPGRSSTGDIVAKTVSDAGFALIAGATAAAQATTLGLGTGDSPEFKTVKLTNLTDGYVPYHASDASGLENSGMYWDNANSRLGIGTTTPAKPLHVNAGDNYIRFDSSANTGTGARGFVIINPTTGDYLNIWNHSADLMVLQSADETTYRNIAINPNGGNVGIGTTTDIANVKLNVVGGSVKVDETQSLMGKSKFNINDDAVYSFTPKDSYGGLLCLTGITNNNTSAIVTYRVTSGYGHMAIVGQSGNVNVTTGELTGTTGTDGKVTLSAGTNGKIYIENRTGQTLYFSFIIIAGCGD